MLSVAYVKIVVSMVWSSETSRAVNVIFNLSRGIVGAKNPKIGGNISQWLKKAGCPWAWFLSCYRFGVQQQNPRVRLARLHAPALRHAGQGRFPDWLSLTGSMTSFIRHFASWNTGVCPVCRLNPVTRNCKVSTPHSHKVTDLNCTCVTERHHDWNCELAVALTVEFGMSVNERGGWSMSGYNHISSTMHWSSEMPHDRH